MFKAKKSVIAMSAGLFTMAAMTTSAFASSYQVKPNDTLWSISQSQHVSVSSIESLNPNVDPMNLQSGQTLQLPDSSSYHVVNGDTLWSISQKLHVSLSSLMAANPNVKPQNLYQGMVLNLPAKSTPAKPSVSAPQTSSAPADVVQVVNLVNSERAKAGLAPLKLNVSLDNMAAVKAKDMRDNNYFDHNSPTYGSPFNMMTQFGIQYSYAGENIAAGQQSPADVMNSWMNSPGHRANILSPNYTEIGVGIAYGGSYGTYWVQEFIQP